MRRLLQGGTMLPGRKQPGSVELISFLFAIPTAVVIALTIGCPNNGGNEPNEMMPKIGNSGLTGKYAGSMRCSTCHYNIHTAWSDTLHAHALETLEGIGQGNNPDCVGCHTVGYGEPGGWVD